MFKKLIAPVVVGGVLLGSLAVGGVAAAATPTTTSTPAAHVRAPRAHRWLRVHRKELRAQGLAISAKTIGITPQALRADLRSGESIAQVASANGSSAAAVESALTTAADNAVKQAETAGKVTATQATVIEARLPARIDKAVNHVF
jgi:uncharacterized membrane protein